MVSLLTNEESQVIGESIVSSFNPPPRPPVVNQYLKSLLDNLSLTDPQVSTLISERWIHQSNDKTHPNKLDKETDENTSQSHPTLPEDSVFENILQILLKEQEKNSQVHSLLQDMDKFIAFYKDLLHQNEDVEVGDEQRVQDEWKTKFQSFLLTSRNKLVSFAKSFRFETDDLNDPAFVGEFVEWYLTKAIFPFYSPGERGPEFLARGDISLWKRIWSFRFIQPHHLDIPPNLVDVIKWDEAINELQKMHLFSTPKGKLECILSCSKILGKGLMENGGTSSADDLLPCIIYTALRANPPNFHSDLQFISTFRSQEQLFAESAYYFISLMTAVYFIENLQPENLSIDPAVYEKYLHSSPIDDFPVLEKETPSSTNNNNTLTPSVPINYIVCPKCLGLGGWGNFGACTKMSVHFKGLCPTCKGSRRFVESTLCEQCGGLGGVSFFGTCDVYDEFCVSYCKYCNGCCYIVVPEKETQSVNSVNESKDIKEEKETSSEQQKGEVIEATSIKEELQGSEKEPSDSFGQNTNDAVVENNENVPQVISIESNTHSITQQGETNVEIKRENTESVQNTEKNTESTTASSSSTSNSIFDTETNFPPKTIAAQILLTALALAVSQHQYDARIRTGLRKLSKRLGLLWNEFYKVESEVAEAILFEGKSALQAPNSSKFAVDNMRFLKVALAAAAGGTALVLTGGLAAPLLTAALGGAIASIGTTISGITIGSVSIMVKILFGATGATVAASKMATRTAGVEQFKFEKISEDASYSGNNNANKESIEMTDLASSKEVLIQSDHVERNGGLHIVIGVVGWIFGGETEEKKIWHNCLSSYYGDHYVLFWETDYLLKLGNELQSLYQRDPGKGGLPTSVNLSASTQLAPNNTPSGFSNSPKNPLSSSLSFTGMSVRAATSTLYHMMLSASVFKAASFIDHPWGIVKDRAEKAGILLAHELVASSLGTRPVTLIGVSNGARLVFYCLEELSRMKSKYSSDENNENSFQSDNNNNNNNNNNKSNKNSKKSKESKNEKKSEDENIVYRDPCSIVEDVVFIGGALPSEDMARWENVCSVVSNRVVNCFSPHDILLAALYRSVHWFSDGVCPAAGVSPIPKRTEKAEKNEKEKEKDKDKDKNTKEEIVNQVWVENIDIGNLVRSHMDYNQDYVLNNILERVSLEGSPTQQIIP